MLSSIIKKEKNIFEYDLKGFFNTVRLESVSRVLAQYKVPKFVVIHCVLLSRGDITPPTVGQMLGLVKASDG